MGYSDLLSGLAEKYLGSREEFRLASEIIRMRLPDFIRKTIENNTYLVKGSVGIGRKAETPWVAVMNPSITTTTQIGYYVVYLFNVKDKVLYLCLAVGWTQFAENYNFKVASDRISKYSTYLSKQLLSKPSGFTTGKIDLGATGTLTKGYEQGQILSKKYNLNALPEEKVMAQDLKSIISVYDELTKLAGSDIVNIDYEDVVGDKKISQVDKRINSATLEGDIKTIEKKLQELISSEPPAKRDAIIKRAVRNPKIARLVKEREKYICEICNKEPFMQKNGKPYAEADHINPLGGETNGIDSPDNMRCLCAQCHAVVTHGSDEEVRKLLNR